MTRALGVIRLSELTKDTTSPARQHEIITAAAKARGSTIVGWAEDLDVSASKIHPMKRPGLGKWLGQDHEYDEILFWRVDRLVRRVGDFADMIKWAEDRGKGLASATEPFDLATPLGKAMAYLTAIFAEMEANATSERVAGAHAYLRQEGRWGGGKPPYGYRSVPNPDGNGYILVVDAEAADRCRELMRRVIAGESVNSITADFNRREILTPLNHERARHGELKTKSGPKAGRDTRGAVWKASTVTQILRNPVLLGYVVHRKSAVTMDDGTPIVRAEPIITETEWDQLQHALSDPARTSRQVRTQTPSLLLRVAFCALCGAPMYRWSHGDGDRRRTHYRCRSHGTACEQKSPCPALEIRSEALNALAETLFLAQVGHVEILEKVYRPGVDHSDEIALLRRSLQAVRREFDGGDYSYPGGEEEYSTRVAGLSERLRVLADLPVTEAGYEMRATGQTFTDRWHASDMPGRRQLMINAGFRLLVSRTKTSIQGLTVAEVDQLARRHERSLKAVLVAAGPAEIHKDTWDEVRSLVDPRANLVIAFELDPDLSRRAGLAAEGRPVTVPDADDALRRALGPVREHVKGG